MLHLLLCFSPSYKALYSRRLPPVSPWCSVTFFISSCFILSDSVTLTLLRSHLMLFSVGFQRIAHLYHPQAQTLSTEASWSFRQQLALQAWEQGKCTDSLRRACAMGLCSVVVTPFNNVSCVVVNKVQSCGEGCVWDMETYFISSSASWFSSAQVYFPVLIPPSDHLPFPPIIPTKGPGCKCWERQTQARCLWRSAHRQSPAQRIRTQKRKWKSPWQLRVLMRKKDKACLLLFKQQSHNFIFIECCKL